MRITRKVFSSKNLINAIKERAFCEGYLAAQKEFAENITWKRGEKINESDINEVEATVMLTGILIDTNRFRNHTGTRLCFRTAGTRSPVYPECMTHRR